MSLIETLERKGPRKLLALDGGGIHGLISLEILAGSRSCSAASWAETIASCWPTTSTTSRARAPGRSSRPAYRSG